MANPNTSFPTNRDWVSTATTTSNTKSVSTIPVTTTTCAYGQDNFQAMVYILIPAFAIAMFISIYILTAHLSRRRKKVHAPVTPRIMKQVPPGRRSDISVTRPDMKQVLPRGRSEALCSEPSVTLAKGRGKSGKEMISTSFNANETDMFGKTWDVKKTLSSLKTQVDVSATGVSVGFRKYSNQYEHNSGLNLYCSVHDEFKVLTVALNIKDYQMLVSPIAELALSSETKLNGHVILELPLCKLETFTSLGVHWISTPLTSSSTVNDIPYEEDPTSSRLDCFYTRFDTKTVRVYTNHLTLFFCTCCKSDIRFELLAQISARVGVIDGYPTLQIKLIFQGLQNSLKRQQENELDKKNGFDLIECGEINLLKKQNSKRKSGFLKCRLTTLVDEKGPEWEHMKRRQDTSPIYQEEQVVDVEDLIRCWFKEHELSYCINWYLKCMKRFCHRLPIVIDVENTSDQSKRDRNTTFTMEVDISTGLNRYQDPIRNFINNLEHEKHQRLLDVLGLRATQERGSVGDERENLYETLSAVRRDPQFSARLNSAMETVVVELCDRKFGYRETMSDRSSCVEVDFHFNTNIENPCSSYSTPITNVKDKTKIQSLGPQNHNNGRIRSNSTLLDAQMDTLRHTWNADVTSEPTMSSELRDKQDPVFGERPSPIGDSHDSDETHRKEIVDINQTHKKSVV